MHDENTIVRERQRLIRREMNRRGIAIKAVQLDGGWKDPSTVLSYFPADKDKVPATMSVASLYRLLTTKALPADLLSLMLPDGFAIVQVPEGIDYDDMAAGCLDYAAEHARARHPESECGVDIGPQEDIALGAKVVRLRA